MRKPISPLGTTEIEILHLVWELGEATVSEVHKRVLENREVAYTTTMTMMKNLADKGYLTYRKEGLSYVYRATQSADAVQQDLLQGVLDKVFKGSSVALVNTLVQNENLSEEEKLAIKKLINELDP